MSWRTLNARFRGSAVPGFRGRWLLLLALSLPVVLARPAALPLREPGLRDLRALRGESESLPERLSDQDFWRLVTEFSEPNGYFQSDNLVSNERLFQQVVPSLQRQRSRDAYLGVAPDQNFTFIAGLEPKIAFIVDIRRGNLQAQLMYKALFELSADRAEFYGRLFSRRRPDGLNAMSGAHEIVLAYAEVPKSEMLYKENLRAIEDQLVRKHGFHMSEEDLRGLEYVYGMFATFGPDITYQSSNASGRARFRFGNMPSYAALQVATDGEGRNRSYLANEDNFRFIKQLETRNLIVPVVGDFAGPKALRAVGRYLADHGATVAAFYVSNVEQYLFQNDVWRNFYDNVTALPLTEDSVFIRSIGGLEVLDPIKGLLRDVADGRVQTYPDLRLRGGK